MSLKPCPFCGGDGVRVGNYSEGVWYAICDGCGTESGYKATREAAIAAWNQRAGDADTDEARKFAALQCAAIASELEEDDMTAGAVAEAIMIRFQLRDAARKDGAA